MLTTNNYKRFLSIIVPHYNLPEELLKRCIDSVLSLEMAADEYEIIIVDDGSDTPPRWVSNLYPDNVKLLENEHGCPGAARNKGIDAAGGKYILFLDADDTLHNGGAMNQCLDILKKELPDILRFKYQRVPEGKKTCNRKHRAVHFGNTISGAAYMTGNNLAATVWSYFIKRDFINKKELHFSPDIYHEDEEFTTIAHFHAQTLIDSDAHIYNYHIRANSITQSRSAKDIKKREQDHLAVIEKLCEFRMTSLYYNNSVQRKALQRKLTTLVVDTIINHLHAGKNSRDIHAFCKEHFTTPALYPLPKQNYGIKYRIFRLLANNRTGLWILRLFIPTRYKQTEK